MIVSCARQSRHFDYSRPGRAHRQSLSSALTQIIPPSSPICRDGPRHYCDDPRSCARLAGVRGIIDWYGRHVDSTGMLGPMPYWNCVDWTPRWDVAFRARRQWALDIS
jgi:hypothetical protein